MVHKYNNSGHGSNGSYGNKSHNSSNSSQNNASHQTTGTRYVHSSYHSSSSSSPTTHVARHFHQSSSSGSNGNNSNNNHNNNNLKTTSYRESNSSQSESKDSANGNKSSAQRKAYRLNGSEYNQIVNGETEYLFSNKQLIESSNSSPIKSLRTILRQFEMIEKRQWPNFLHDLSILFTQASFAKLAAEKPHRIVDDVTRIFSRILTTKLFPDIIQGIITCLTNLSFALRHNCKDLHSWLFDFYRISPDETKLVLLRSIDSIIKRKGKGITEHMTSVMINLRRALEETESQTILLELVEIFMVIASTFPSVFQGHFSHIVDILIAWHLDSITNPLVASKLAAAFLAFQSFWLDDIMSTNTLLRNFIEDFETNFDSLKSEIMVKDASSFATSDSIDKASVTETLTKMAGLAEIYVTVFKSLGTFPPSRACSSNFVLSSLAKVLSIDIEILKIGLLHEHLIISCNNVCIFTLEVMASDGQEYLTTLKDEMINYLELVHPHLTCAMSKTIVSTLNLMIHVIKYFGPSLPVAFVSRIMSSRSPIQQLKFYPIEDIQLALFSMHHTLLDLRSLPLLIEVYRGFLVQLHKSLSVILKSKLEDFTLLIDLQASNHSEFDINDTLSTDEALLTVKSCLVSLTALANSKNNLIGLWALKPCLFDLVICHIDPSREEFVKNTNLHQTQFMLLNLIYCHSKRHSHFISSSNLLRSSNHSLTTGFTFEPPTSNFLMRLFQFLNRILRRERLELKQRLLCIRWFSEILSDITPYIPKLMEYDEFKDAVEIAINLAFFKNAQIAIEANKIAELLLLKANTSLTLSLFKKIIQSCSVQIGHADENVSRAFCNLLNIVPLSITATLNHIDNELTTATSHSFSDEACDFSILSRDFVIYPQDIIMTCWALMKTEHSFISCFSPWYFQSIMAFLLDGETKDDTKGLAWLERLFLLSQSDSAPIKLNPGSVKSTGHLNTSFGSEATVSSVFQSNHQSLLFWAVWQCVSYCIANKLKTPYGKPQDLLTRISVALNSLSNGCSIKYSANSTAFEPSLIQVKLLLLLMETLDKQIHNAIEGSGYRIAPVSKVSSSFFRTNKATCYDWLARSRFSVIKLAAKCGEHELAWRNGCELLNHLTKNKASSSEVESCLLLIIESLVEMEDSDTISGFLTWSKDKLNLKCLWGRAALKEAAGHYEVAKIRYEEQLETIENQRTDELSTVNNNIPSNSHLIEFLTRRISKCKQNLTLCSEASASSRNSPDKGNIFNSFIDGQDDSVAIAEMQKLTEEFNNLTFDTEEIAKKSQRNLLKILSTSETRQQQSDVVTNNLKNMVKATVLISGDLKSCSKFNLMLQVANLCKNGDSINSLTKLACQSAHNTMTHQSRQHWSMSDLMFLVECANAMSSDHSKTPVELFLYLSKTIRKTENFKLSANLLASVSPVVCGNNSLKGVTLMTELIKTLPIEIDDITSHASKAEQLSIIGEAFKVLKGLTEPKKAIECAINKVASLSDSMKNETDARVKKVHAENLHTLAKFLDQDGKVGEKIDDPSRFNLPVDNEFKNQEFSSHLVPSLYHAATVLNPQYSRAHLALANWSYHNWTNKITSSGEASAERAFLDKESDEIISSSSTVYCALFSLESYFKFLASSSFPETNASVVLKILKILSLTASSDLVKEKLSALITECPTAAWKSVTIQLFSYLTHTKDNCFKKFLTDILCRIGQESPHLVIFPALAGSLADKNNRLIVDISTEDRSGAAGKRVLSDELVPDVDDAPNGNNTEIGDSDTSERLAMLTPDEPESNRFSDVLSSARASLYTPIVDVLTSQHPALISQTIRFINEMRRITVLWDELWISTILYRLPELTKRVNALEEEVERMNNTNCNLRKEAKIKHLSEKFSHQFQRMAGFFDEIKQATVDQHPETPYEKWFQVTFSKQIISCVLTLKDTENLTRPCVILQSVQQLLTNLQKRSHDMSSGKSQLVMDTISPALSQMTNTVIPVPGLRTQGVVISKISKTISILHAKTKPKRVSIVGSDGEMHNFLFKGHEDLHLDERIMQLLQITNQLLARESKSVRRNACLASLYRARHYSVTPLGPKCGLIQWVDGGPAIYGFYRRWLVNKSTGDATVKTKPNEIFTKKLHDKKVTSSNRNDWPKETMVAIHKELTNETADDLISRELWFSSTSARQYYHLTQSFIRSNAVMCMIGYIIGLGDRHLDNILLDLSTGEIIHVDYNVCFEKGKKLRVPEKVPCRLTKSIVSTFGITGVNGSFKAHCEHVLGILRRERETLLLILESFLHDPLYEWILMAESASSLSGSGYSGTKSINAPSHISTHRNSSGSGRGVSPSIGTINPFALKAWRRVKLKLEGREVDSVKKSTVPDQVELIIKQAMDVENLALMFEGWTSWV